MNRQRGRLIVIDGIDGSGKTIQIYLLSQYLKQKDIPFEIISFPQYGKNKYAIQIKKYLQGEMGRIEDLDPYSIAKLYASDRLTVREIIKGWLDNGKLVISNRYVSSNKAHLRANLPSEKREEFFKWIDQLEYEINKIPKEDLTILLKLDAKLGQQNATADHLKDIHEENLAHEEKAAKIYLELSKTEKNSVVVNCMDDDKMRPKECIHKDILRILEGRFLDEYSG